MIKILLFTVCLLGSMQSHAQTLLAQYNFDNDMLDAIGNHHGSPQNGPVFTSDRFGNPNSAVFLDGIDDYIILADALTLQSATYTYDFWVNAASNPGVGQAKCIFSIGGNGGDQLATNAGIQGWNVSGYQNPSGTYNLTSGVTPVLNQWYHITGIRDVSSSSLYVDGILVDNAVFGAATSPKYGQNNAFFGRRTNNGPVGPQFFHGAIDDFKIYSGVNTPLPLDLLRFEAVRKSNAVLLQWSAANMHNVAGFEVEKSNDAKSFRRIGFTKATENTAYSFSDQAIPDRHQYYRLKMMDIDGKYTYSKTIYLLNAAQMDFSLYPNPVQDELHVTCSAARFNYSIYDLFGKEYNSGIAETAESVIPCSALVPGVYFIKTEAGGQGIMKKFIKN